MGRKLLLNTGHYPSLITITDYTSGECATLAEFENSLLEAINARNPKLHVESVEYTLDKNHFSLASSSKFLGLIVEEQVCSDAECAQICRRPFDWQFIRKGVDNNLVMQPVIYTLMTNVVIGGRNVFAAQLVFPFLIDLMEKCTQSSDSNPWNHPVYILYISNEDVRADTIQKDFAALSLMGIEIIDVFHKSSDSSSKPRTLEHYCNRYLSDTRVGSTYVTDDLTIDIDNKTIHVKADNWVIGKYLEMRGSGHGINGSSDKFYWIHVLPFVVAGVHEGYTLEYAQYEQFILSEQTLAGNSRFFNTPKFHRMLALRDFFEKLNTLRNE